MRKLEGYALAALPAIISGVTLLLVGWLARQFAAFGREHKVLLESQRNQLKASIVALYERAVERGYVTPMELDTANRMADSYFALGGNHYVHAVIARLNETEIRGEIPS